MHVYILPKFIPMFDLSGFSPGPALGFGKYTLKVPLKYYKYFVTQKVLAWMKHKVAGFSPNGKSEYGCCNSLSP